MDRLIAKYLDGDLTGEDSKRLMVELERNPAVERELRGHEDLLMVVGALESSNAPRGLVDDVMQEIGARGRPRSLERRWRPWPPRIRFAAAVVAAFALGHLAAHVPPRSNAGRPVSEVSVQGQVAAKGTAGLRAVRVVYQPSRAEVRRVTIAGSFNGWNIDRTPLTRDEGGLWIAVILLPPGRHEYMFVEDGERWVMDPLASRTIDDGFGGRNSVLDLGV